MDKRRNSVKGKYIELHATVLPSQPLFWARQIRHDKFTNGISPGNFSSPVQPLLCGWFPPSFRLNIIQYHEDLHLRNFKLTGPAKSRDFNSFQITFATDPTSRYPATTLPQTIHRTTQMSRVLPL
jgi:hypothetical protein